MAIPQEVLQQRETPAGGKPLLPPYIIVLSCLFFALPARDLYYTWQEVDNFGQGIMCLLAAGVFIWDRRGQFMALESRGHWMGVPFCAGSAVFLGFCRLLAEARGVTNGLVLLEGVALIGFFIGCVLLARGWRGLALLWPVPMFLFLMLPTIYLNYLGVPGRLQRTAAISSEAALRLLGISTYRTGNVIHTPQITANVVDACSGLRSLSAAVPFTIFVDVYALRQWGSRIILFVVCIPTAIAANIFRITLNCALANWISKDLAEGIFHTIEGTLVYVICLGTIALAALLLRRREKKFAQIFYRLTEAGADPEDDDAPTDAQEQATPPSPARSPGRTTVAAWWVVGALLAIGTLFQGVEAGSIWQARRSFPTGGEFKIPHNPANYWLWTRLEDKDIIELKDCDIMGFWHVRGRGGERLEVLVFYWRPAKADARLNIGHVPDICFVANGMKMTAAREVPFTYSVAGRKVNMDLHVRRFRAQSQEEVFVTYWSQIGLAQMLENQTFSRLNVRGLVKGALHYARTREGCLNAPQIYFRIRSLSSEEPEAAMLEEHLRLAAFLAPTIVSQIYGGKTAGGDVEEALIEKIGR